MMECGREAARNNLSGPWGGKWFFNGREMGSTHRQTAELPGATRRLFADNLPNNLRSSWKNIHGLYVKGVDHRDRQEEPSYLPPLTEDADY